ncbi:DUF3352 domain-containing protein [Candidatus Viridilinea mediisalina]|uniref:DUF3352 domain-containing protein n=1 Tax=Candidatus Viridilinea mediisalina TaxID=2024553 RepID=A0A2A6RK31_9CHLR|nr:DUF3352 domain-containing protein [Candidatus Viridilinea mediisalina]PDW03246.1 hypothetical protein CJ255_09680 [Candidatus Viridilinea mediisalina]
MTTPEATAKAAGFGGAKVLIIGMLVVGVLVLSTGLVGAGYLTWQYMTQRPDTIPRILAAETHVFAAVTPSLADLPQIIRLQQAFPDDDQVVPSSADEPVTNQLAEALGVNFEQDIAPWLGTEIAWALNRALLDAVPNVGAIDRPNLDDADEMILIFTSRNNGQAQAFLDKQRQHRESQGMQFAVEELQGVQIYARQGGGPSEVLDAFALVRDYVIFAGSPELIRGIVTRDPSSNATLEANPNFQKVRAALPNDRLGYLYVAGAPLLEIFGEQGFDLPLTLERQQADQRAIVAALHGLGFAISAYADGIAFDAVASLDRSQLGSGSQALLAQFEHPIQTQRIGRISDASATLVAFAIPPSFKASVLDGIREQPGGERQLQEFEREFGFSLEDDLLAWFYGEAQLVLLPRVESDLPMTGYFALKTEQISLAEQGIAKILRSLEMMLGFMGDFQFEQREIGGSSWQIIEPMPGVQLGQAFVNDEFVLGVGAEAISAATSPASSFSQQHTYQAATRQQPNPLGSMLYINMPVAVNLSRHLGFYDPDLRERMQPIRAMAFSASPGFNAEGVATARLFIVIAAE